MIPGIDLHQIVNGQTLAQAWEYYTINVKYLGTMTHEQFCEEFPEAAKAIARATHLQAQWEKLAQSLEP